MVGNSILVKLLSFSSYKSGMDMDFEKSAVSPWE